MLALDSQHNGRGKKSRSTDVTQRHTHTQSCLRMSDSNTIYSSVLLTVQIKALLNLVIKGLYDALLEHSLNLKTKINLLKLLEKRKAINYHPKVFQLNVTSPKNCRLETEGIT